MKNTKKKNSLMNHIIIGLSVILVILFIVIFFNTQLFKSDNKQNIIESKLAFEEKEYKNLLGYDFYTKDDGTVLIKLNSSSEIVNIYSDGTIINVKEKVVKIEAYIGEGNKPTSNVLLLTENGNLYNLDLGQDIINDSNLYKYVFNQKIKDLKVEDIHNVLQNTATVVELENGDIRLVGPKNILKSTLECSIGTKVLTLSSNGDYIVIEDDNKIRIGNTQNDKYFSISQEKWINENANITNYDYLTDDTGKIIICKDFEILKDYATTHIYIITDDNRLIYMSISDESLLENDKILKKYEIKLNKIVSKFVINELTDIVTIKFTDGTHANIKDNNLIFGMLSENNKFFTFSKQDLKENIEYEILTDKLGINYKIKDFQVIYNYIKSSDTYIISVFIITEDNNMIMTCLSNNHIYNYIDQIKPKSIDSDKLIDTFENMYSKNDGYTTKIVFKDGTKIDFRTFVKDYLPLS